MTSNLDRSQNTGSTSSAQSDAESPAANPASGNNRGAQGFAVPASASRRVRARLARRITGQRNTTIRPVLEPLVSLHRELYPKADLALLQRAYDVAEERHASQRRKSGDPYITHPLAVASILAELGMDTTTLVAALLHDTVEDTGYSLEQLTDEFGEEVAHLVDGVTKLDKVVLGNAAEGETIRKMIIAMARDPRVLVIKVADRLHNMRTMRFLPPEKQARKARETLEVIAPPGPPAGHGDSEVGTRGPVLRDPASQEVRRDRAARRRPCAVPRHLPREGSRGDQRDADGVAHQRRRRGQAQALLVDLPEDDRQGPRLRRHPRPGRRANPVRRGPRLLCGRRRRPLAVAADGGPVQGLHRAAALRRLPVAAHHRGRAGGQTPRGADPHPRHAPDRRVRYRRALAVQGDQGQALR